jgi:serine/threonine-protein kinase
VVLRVRRRGARPAGAGGSWTTTRPRRIGGYRVSGELGRGGMATTYRAERLRDGLPVAIKVPHEAGDPTYQERFLREGRLGETLHHPRIVRIVEAGEEGGRPFLALELIPGTTLREAMEAAGGPYPVARALTIARDIAEALDYAHGKGVVHRDLKPENVMLLPDGTVKVMDFGVARIEGQPGLTTSRFFFGSPVYAAPELVDPLSVDHRADLYSLGVILFELLEGRPPFAHESVFKLLEMHQREPLPDPAALDHPPPPEVWKVIARLLAKEPARRYGSAQVLLADLRALLFEPSAGRRSADL